MILEFLLNPLFELLTFAVANLNDLSVEIPTTFLGTLSSFLNISATFLPLGDLFLMSGIWFAIATFNIWWTFTTWLWKMLPFV